MAVMKRSYGAYKGSSSGVKKPRKKAKITVPRVSQGYLRTGGFYGRFSGKRDSELKFFDTALSFTFDSTQEIPATGQLNLIPQGVTESTRVGRKCVLKNIFIRGRMLNPYTTVQSGSTYRLIVVWDKQCNGAAAATTEVLNTGDNYSVRNLENINRFVILKDWFFVINPTANVSDAAGTGVPAPTTKIISWGKKCNIPLEFSGTTGAIGTIKSNNVFLIAQSSNQDDQCTFEGICRVRFSDG